MYFNKAHLLNKKTSVIEIVTDDWPLSMSEELCAYSMHDMTLIHIILICVAHWSLDRY